MVLTGLLIQGREKTVPLKSISVRAILQGYVVGFLSKLSYENDSSDPFEVFFRTPVDDSYAVVGLEAVIDGRMIRAKIEEKKKARKMYREAIASGYTAALGEEVKGDIFMFVLGNLPPGKKAEIHLKMVAELDVERDGSVRFVLPTVLKPRYTPAGSTDPLRPITTAAEQKTVKYAKGPSEFKFDMAINGAERVAKVTSPSHGIITRKTANQVITVSLKEAKPKDIVILVHPKEPHKPLVIVEPGLADGENDFQKSATVMVSFFPEFSGDVSCTRAACEFVFLVDRSGSMRGDIRDAAQTLLFFLKSIPEGCYFNIIGFGNSYEELFPESVPYNQDNVEQAVAHAEGLQANLGGTELFDPLEHIFGLAQMKGLPRQVFVLTDGSISNTESVIKLVAQNSHNTRCFSFGIGSGASSTLVKGIAQAGKGTAEFIASGERMQPKVIRSLKSAMQPAVTNAKLHFNLPNGHTVQAAPVTVPAIFIGERTIVYAIISPTSTDDQVTSASNEASVRLSGDLLGGEIEHKMKFEIPLAVAKDNQRVTTIHHLAAKRLIREMESHDGGKDKKDDIIKLSCNSSVVSSLTGFIAIDEDRNEAITRCLRIWDINPREDLDMDYGCCEAAPSSPPDECAPPMERKKTERDRALRPGYKMATKKGSSARRTGAPAGARMDAENGALPDARPRAAAGARPRARIGALPDARPRAPAGAPSRRGADKRSGLPGLSFHDYVTTELEKLTTIVGLQLASGAWRLTTELASIIDKKLDAIKASCPAPCEGELETIWATIIALTYLRQKESSQKEEWELIAAKAEVWLAKQSLPEGCSIQGLRQKAVDIVC